VSAVGSTLGKYQTARSPEQGFGRATLADRNSRLVIARGEAEETIKHLRANLNCERITPADYWPLHNRAVTIVKMLNSYLA
jgi:four helix bundle protein